MSLRTRLNTNRFFAIAAAALTLLAAYARPIQAADNVGKFTLSISEVEKKLMHPNGTDWETYFQRDLPIRRMHDRNMPTFELKNDATSTAPLTELHLTIGDTRFNFSDDDLGTFAKLAKSTPGFNITSSTVGGDELVVKIGNGGLAKGQSLRFQVQIGVDAANVNDFFHSPDYRTVLFDMNGINAYGGTVPTNPTDDNSQVWAIFGPPPFTTEHVPFVDASVPVGGQFYNENMRRYRDKDPVGLFQVAGALAAVPEPGSILLTVVGLAGGLVFSTRSRRHRNAG